MKFPVSEKLRHADEFAATIAPLKYHGLERGLLPTAKEETATVSFINFCDKFYAVTARHVIDYFDELAEKDGEKRRGYSCVQAPGVAILGPFLTPPANFPDPKPDIAICPIAKGLPSQIGKSAFPVSESDDANWPVSHALAVGFPTSEKSDVSDGGTATRLSLPCVRALAEGLNSDGSSDQVQFFSNLSEQPEVISLSGMSGGPVFWSEEANCGLMGFVKEALDVVPKEGEETIFSGPRVSIVCQRTDFSIIKSWIDFVEDRWQTERDKINAAISKDTC